MMRTKDSFAFLPLDKDLLSKWFFSGLKPVKDPPKRSFSTRIMYISGFSSSIKALNGVCNRWNGLFLL